MRPKGRFAQVVFAAIALLGCGASTAMADFAKTITVKPGVEVNAVTTWYYKNCDTSLGLGSYTINVAPERGDLRFANVSGPLPGCPSGSPDLPAVAAYYTWTSDTLGAQSDYFQLYYELGGNVAEVIDVTVDLATSTHPATCHITSRTIQSVPGVLDARARVGIGEEVYLSANAGANVSWSIHSGGGSLSQPLAGKLCPSSGTGSSVSGGDACFLAPYANDTTVVTATPSGGTSCEISFSTVQPTGLIFQRLQSPPLPPPGYAFLNAAGPFYEAAMYSVIFLTPGDVSFANVAISEHDIDHPYVAPPYEPPVLVPVAGTYAWLVGCDYDHNFSFTSSPFSDWTSYFTFADLGGGHETEFSQVETILYHQRNFANVTYTKQQIAALSPNGKWVKTPYAAASMLDFPWNSPPSGLAAINRQTCKQDVLAQFTRPGAAAKAKQAERPAQVVSR